MINRTITQLGMAVVLLVLGGVFSGPLASRTPSSDPQASVGSNRADEGDQTKPAYALLERLVRIPPQVSVLQVSSHNRKGENGDAGWPLYRDELGDEVIFDAAGPGCVKSMWGTAFDPAAVLQFYFDGETEARIRLNIIDFYKGSHPLFPPPLVSYEKRGRWGDAPFAGNSFVPIPFATAGGKAAGRESPAVQFLPDAFLGKSRDRMDQHERTADGAAQSQDRSRPESFPPRRGGVFHNAFSRRTDDLRP